MTLKIALAATKGGCGKSTLCVLLAGEYASMGLTVLVLDADPQQSVSKWFRRCAANGSSPTGVDVKEIGSDDEFVDAFRNLSADVLLIDMQGAVSQILPIAVANVDLVVIPAIPSEFDAAEIGKIPKLLEGYAGRGPRKPYRVVLNCVDGIETNTGEFRATIQSLKDRNIVYTNAYISKRTKYKEVVRGVGGLHLMQKKDDGLAKAIANIKDLADELLVAASAEADGGQVHAEVG